jgi:hypothetical protein
MTSISRPLLVVLLSTMSVVPGLSQTRESAPDDALFRKLASLDAEVFDAYNTCDLEKFGSFFADDVEFYHDKTGLARGRQTLVDAVKANICGKTRRDLVPGTLEVHPMDNFGAVQIGVHRFCDARSTSCDGTTGGVAKFIHLWHEDKGDWKITRVISYDHAPTGK